MHFIALHIFMTCDLPSIFHAFLDTFMSALLTSKCPIYRKSKNFVHSTVTITSTIRKIAISHWSKVPKNVQSREQKVWQQYYHFYFLLTVSKCERFCENWKGLLTLEKWWSNPQIDEWSGSLQGWEITRKPA